MGLLRDLAGAKSVGVIAEDPSAASSRSRGRSGVVARDHAVDQPGATPANNIINALKGRNAIVVAPSPKGHRRCALLLEFMHAELDRVGAPRDLVQQLPAPVTREHTAELMRQADLVVATGSQTNVRAAYASGTPAIGVGAGNVAVIVDETADCRRCRGEDRALEDVRQRDELLVGEQRDRRSTPVADALLAALARERRRAARPRAKRGSCRHAMFRRTASSQPPVIAQDAPAIAAARRPRAAGARARARFLIVDETRRRPRPSRSRARSCRRSWRSIAPPISRRPRALAERPAGYQGAGPFGRTAHARERRARSHSDLTLPGAASIVNQAHCFATGGSFDNALPFSLSMGCGTWVATASRTTSNYRHFLNITRVAHQAAAPSRARASPADELFGDYRRRYGRVTSGAQCVDRAGRRRVRARDRDGGARHHRCAAAIDEAHGARALQQPARADRSATTYAPSDKLGRINNNALNAAISRKPTSVRSSRRTTVGNNSARKNTIVLGLPSVSDRLASEQAKSAAGRRSTSASSGRLRGRGPHAPRRRYSRQAAPAYLTAGRTAVAGGLREGGEAGGRHR